MANPVQGAATREVNAELAIDFGGGKRPDELRQVRQQRRVRRNVHVQKLHQIVGAIGQDDADVDELYRIATFTSDIGAASARRTMKRQEDQWPTLLPGYAFDVQTRVVGDGSELWAGVIAVDVPEVTGDVEPEPEPTPDDEVDGEVGGVDEEGFYDPALETIDEPDDEPGDDEPDE